MGRISRISGAILVLCALPLTLRAAESSEVEELRRRLEDLTNRYEAQNSALRALEARLQQLEGSHAQTGPKTFKGAYQATADDRQPVRSTAAQAATTGKAQEEEVVKQAPVARSVEAVLQKEHAVFGRPFTLEAGVTYARSDRRQINLSGFLALDAIFLGRISVDEVKADILTFDLTGRYSPTNRLQFELNAPFLYRQTTFQKGGVGGAAAALSETDVTLNPTLGDASAGIHYRLIPESASWPDVVWNLRGKAPTGTHPFGIKTVTRGENLIVPEELPSGNGVWTASTGLSFVKTSDPAILFANLSYFYNFKQSFDDISSSRNTVTPGDVKLGNSFQYAAGIAFALSERMSLSFSYSQRFTHKSSIRSRGGNWQSIVGSDANAVAFNTGLTYALTPRLTMLANVGIGLTPDAPDVQVVLKFPYTF